MSRLDDLPPDQKAALSLLLAQRKSYAELAALLNVDERAVHDRAHAALAVLAPRQARELGAEDRAEIGDYLLGQQASASARIRTRALLERSEPARAWVSAVAGELSSLGGSLAEVPLAGAHPLPSSRTGGALLLAAIGAIVVVAIVLLTSGGGGSKNQGANAASASSTAASTSSSAGKAKEDKRITLTSPDPTSKTIGVAEVLSEGSKYAFYLAAERLPPSHGFFYAVWLYNSPTDNEALSKSPPVGSDGRLQGGALLPSDAGRFHEMLLTKETSQRPTHPGPIVLHGEFGLH